VKIVVAVLLVVAAVVAGAVLFTRDDNSGPTTNASGSGTTVAPETPELTFKIEKALPIRVTPTQSPKKLAAAATAAGDSAVDVIDTIYTEGYLDPSSWDGGNYDDAWTQFTDDTATQAEAHADVLTAGPAAGDAYTTIEPAKALVKPRVLMDDAGKAVSVEAVVTFTAKGMHDDGSFTLFKSTGHYFLKRDGSDWKVVAFQVHRDDSEQPAPSPSAGATASSAPTGSPS
jgi:hypothetical protein